MRPWPRPKPSSLGPRARICRGRSAGSRRAALADVREWPVDLSTLVRLLLYLGIGLGSWVGAALVDVGVETLLR